MNMNEIRQWLLLAVFVLMIIIPTVGFIKIAQYYSSELMTQEELIFNVSSLLAISFGVVIMLLIMAVCKLYEEELG